MLLLDPLEDDLRPEQIAAVEARVQDDDERRARFATPAPACRCQRPWPFERGHCLRCGHQTWDPAATGSPTPTEEVAP